MSTFEIVVLSAIGGFFLWSVWQNKTAARKIKKISDDLQKEKALFRADPKDYPHLDDAWYDEREGELRNLGYRLIGNLGMESVHSYVRASVSSDGHECIGFYHAKFPGLRGLMMRLLGVKDQYVVEATTSFSDGSIEITTTAPESALLSVPEPLRRLHIAPDSSVRNVAMVHSKRVAAILVQRPDLDVIPVRTFEDLVATARREEDLKRAHYAAHGGISREDLERIGGAENRGIAHEVHDEIEKLREKEAG
jgi:hypothetical protein